MKKLLLLLLTMLAVCGVESRAAEKYISCTVSITSGENYAECDAGTVSTNGKKVYVTPRSGLFVIKSVVWTDGTHMADIKYNIDPMEGCYTAPQQSGSVTVTFSSKLESLTVTFDLNGADGTVPDDQQLTLGEKVVRPSDPEQEGYDFYGWFLDQACTKPFDFNTPLDEAMPYQDTSGQFVLKLYAGLRGLYSSGTCGKEDDTHDGSQLRWALYKTPGSDTADRLVISGNGEMAQYSFMEWSQIKTVVMEDGVTTIGQSAFRGCSSLTSVTIGASVTTIGQSAFNDCTNLTRVTIPASVTTIGQSAFRGCSSLTSVTIPASVTTIRKDAFLGCSSLTSVTIPASVTTIDQGTFWSCTGLTSVTIPASVTDIGEGALGYCKSLTDVYCYAASVPSTDPDAFAFSNYNNATLHVLAAALGDYQNTEPWKDFESIVGYLTPLPKCATPTIAFANGKLTFDCETEGVEFVHSISTSLSNSGNKVSLKEMGPTYIVSVYAVKDGYDRSDEATKTITYQAKSGDVNGDGEVNAVDLTKLIEILLK